MSTEALARRESRVPIGEIEAFARILGITQVSMLAAYCDESGKHGDARVFVMSGLRASVKNWHKFRRSWESALDRLGIPSFHAADCEGGYGAFKGMSRDQRDEIQRSLISVANEFNYVGVSIGMPMELFAHAVEPLDPSHMPRYKKSPYFMLFQTLIGNLLSHRHASMRNSRIAFFFDRQDEFRGTAERLYEQIKIEPDQKYAPRMGPLTFLDKSDPEGVPLQLADMFAYESYKMMSHVLPDFRQELRIRRQAYLLFRPLHYKNLLVLKNWDEESIGNLHRVFRARIEGAIIQE